MALSTRNLTIPKSICSLPHSYVFLFTRGTGSMERSKSTSRTEPKSPHMLDDTYCGLSMCKTNLEWLSISERKITKMHLLTMRLRHFFVPEERGLIRKPFEFRVCLGSPSYFTPESGPRLGHSTTGYTSAFIFRIYQGTSMPAKARLRHIL